MKVIKSLGNDLMVPNVFEDVHTRRLLRQTWFYNNHHANTGNETHGSDF